MQKVRPPTREEASLDVDAELILALEKARRESDYLTVADIDCYWLLPPHQLDCM